MARKSRSLHAPSSKARYTSKPVKKSKPKPSSTPRCLPLMPVVSAIYKDIRVHLSQFFKGAENLYFDKPDHREKARAPSSKHSLSYDAHDHQKKTRDHRSSKPNFSYDVHDHQKKDDNKSKPSLSYQCYPFSHFKQFLKDGTKIILPPSVEDGNKIIMPPSAVDAIISMKKTEYPNAFKIINPLVRKYSHCGRLPEYSAEEGKVYLPNWMMNSLSLQIGQLVNFECAFLPRGTFLKVQPHSTKFIMNLSNRKEAMERMLKGFACVTTGDTIRVNHENQSYYLNIVEARPKKAVSFIEANCEIEFLKTLDHEDATSSEEDASRRLDKDDGKLVVSFIKYSKTRSFDGRRQREDRRQH